MPPIKRRCRSVGSPVKKAVNNKSLSTFSDSTSSATTPFDDNNSTNSSLVLEKESFLTTSLPTSPPTSEKSSGNKRKHLEKCHPNWKDSSPPEQPQLDFAPPPDCSTAPTSAEEQAYFGSLLLEFLIENSLPFSLLESPTFKKLLKFANKYLKSLSADLASSRIVVEYEKQKELGKAQLSSLDVSPCLSLDYWTSKSGIPILGVFIHYIDKYFELITFLLDLKPVSHPHSAANTKIALDEILQEYGISEITSITADNASNISSAIDMFHVAKDGLNLVDESVNIVRKLTVKIHRSQALQKKIVDSTEALNSLFPEEALVIPPTKLVRDVETRWSSTYEMLKSYNKWRNVLVKYGENDRTIAALNPTDDEYLRLKSFNRQLLKPLADCTTTISGSKYVTLSLCVVLFDSLLNTFKDIYNNSEDIWIKTTAKLMFDRLIKSQKYFIDYVAFAAVLLDPRYKNNKLREFAVLDKEEHWEQLISMIDTSENSTLAAEIPSTGDQAASDSEDDNFAEKALAVREEECEIVDQNKSELDRYLDERVSASDPLLWWKCNNEKYPNLSRVARQFLASPASSVACESLFSVVGHMIHGRWNLDRETIRSLIGLKSRLNSGRIRSGTLKMAVEKPKRKS
ncbi:hypothetical protein GEMRC1_003788 [Eukaryota sp. GEM-RC1]